VQGAGCRVQGAGCGVQVAGCRVQGAGCKVQGAGCRGLWVRVASGDEGARSAAGRRTNRIDFSCTCEQMAYFIRRDLYLRPSDSDDLQLKASALKNSSAPLPEV